ncbi:hypothetical protein [Desulfogranum japonicum]|uniref:hypothetical protein n=1 Tax=Desulfogranum japonicum TaxID=231447 RepID=UPI000490A571|nr:hypothetical protein [Desulfogranum japonicum]
MNPNDFANSKRDSKTERDVLKWLRAQEDVPKFEFIWRVMNINAGKALPLVKKGQLKPIFLDVILRRGLVYGDASSVEWWIESVIEGLGYGKVLKIIKEHMDNAPLCVEKSLYFLPWLYENHPEYHEEINSLKSEFNGKYPNFTSKRSVGTHPTE